MKKQTLFRTVTMALALATTALVGCSSGDGALGGDTSADEIQVSRGAPFSATQTMRTTTHLLSSMSWTYESPTQAAPAISLSNTNCATKIQQDAVKLPKTADNSGSSDWTCTVYGTMPSDALPNSVYNLLLTGTDDVGNFQTTKVPVRVR